VVWHPQAQARAGVSPGLNALFTVCGKRVGVHKYEVLAAQ
jgi:hypothetical protein